ncbi:zinc finger protein ZAT1-like [Aristolochia californica]|uniref:zinc finger protein ZAT1-like n=1 Tax=Aristolochia californica TaxID=171875 RepID=UPI0035E190EE
MEKHTCKLCSRSFANGRALGGHMRSHMATLAPTPQPPKPQLRNEITSALSSSSSSSSEEEEHEEEDEGKGVYYGLRENPKKSIRLVDPEFSFAVDAGSVVQDRESETESSKAPFRRRSKRNRKSVDCDKMKLKVEAEAEPLSSVSDTTPEEDVALSLMMLSRDIWMRDAVKLRFEESEDSEELKFYASGRSKYQCGTCKKVFRSYQALGGHRASHKKIRGCVPATSTFPAVASTSRVQETESEDRNDASPRQQKIHECPVCFRVFGSGQALGGHKRSHLSGSGTATTTAKFGDNLIDLNLPPIEDDDASQIELSAVSDAEFVDAGN